MISVVFRQILCRVITVTSGWRGLWLQRCYFKPLIHFTLANLSRWNCKQVTAADTAIHQSPTEHGARNSTTNSITCTLATILTASMEGSGYADACKTRKFVSRINVWLISYELQFTSLWDTTNKHFHAKTCWHYTNDQSCNRKTIYVHFFKYSHFLCQRGNIWWEFLLILLFNTVKLF